MEHFHLSPHENILTIALINIHYLYTNILQEMEREYVPIINLLENLLLFCMAIVYIENRIIWSHS